MTIFKFRDFQSFFTSLLNEQQDNRGYRSRLAKAAAVHPSYITRISDGSVTLSLDQAAGLADFWNMAEDEKEYLLWLVLKARAGNVSLRNTAERKLVLMKKEAAELSASLPAEKISTEIENEYYFSWVYSAVHLLAAIPGQNQIEKIALRLGLDLETVKSAVAILERLGMVEQTASGKIKSLKSNVHLSQKSWMAPMQHRNWRVNALERASRPNTAITQYTGVHSLSREDLDRLKLKIKDFLVETDQVVRPSSSETVAVLCLDFFEL